MQPYPRHPLPSDSVIRLRAVSPDTDEDAPTPVQHEAVRILGQIMITIGEIVANERGEVRLRLAREFSVDDPGLTAEMNRVFQQINNDLDDGFEIVGENATGCAIKEPLTPKQLDAIARTIRQLLPVEVKAEAITHREARKALFPE